MKRFTIFLIAFALSFSLGLDASQKGGKSGGGSKPVHVKGYTKKDGTYVAPHDRKAPETKTGETTSTARRQAKAGARAGTAVAAAAASAAKEPAVKSTSTSSSAAAVARNEKGRIQRSAAARHAFARQTGYPSGRPGYVIDHVVPLACGGKDAPENMQWQTIAEGKAKDRTERVGCK